jgi:hypothetical protein
MNKTEATKILNVPLRTVNNCIKNKIIKLDLKGELIDESVYEYLKELEERRKIPKVNWINGVDI